MAAMDDIYTKRGTLLCAAHGAPVPGTMRTLNSAGSAWDEDVYLKKLILTAISEVEYAC